MDCAYNANRLFSTGVYKLKSQFCFTGLWSNAYYPLPFFYGCLEPSLTSVIHLLDRFLVWQNEISFFGVKMYRACAVTLVQLNL